MPTPFESAQLNLKLYELRREPTLRDARNWFLFDFNPESLEQLATLAQGERNASFRMVLGYWEMAASLVSTNAIDRESFLAAHSEVVVTFGKVLPFLAEIRASTGEPTFCEHLELLLATNPEMKKTVLRRREKLMALAKAKAAQAATASAPQD